MIKVALKRFLTEDSQSKTLLERLRDAEVPGIDNVQENEPTPESFRNEEGKVDLYKALNEIKKNKQEHSTWYEQL